MSITLENVAEFSHARRSHFALFQDSAFCSIGPPDPALCDLKVYQDHLAYLFLRDNLAPGARVLEVGGGDSRVLAHFASTFECWNVDRCEGLGNGPKGLDSRPYRIVRDYLGNGNAELPDAYFDCVFSISALEHMPDEPRAWDDLLADLRRVLKPGGLSLHLFDVVLDRPFGHWFHGLVPYLSARLPLATRPTTADDLVRDPDLYVMSKTGFDRHWLPHVKEPYEGWGRPSNVTLCWRG